MVYLRQLLANEGGAGRLDRAALDLVTLEEPDFDPAPCLDRLNELASSLGDRLRNFNDGRDFVEKARAYLFEELGFHGNQTEYFDPRNSFLNHVLERRTGLPITLSVLYLEIARRLHMPVYGIDLPRHFIVQFDDGRYSAFIDPFHGGAVVTVAECYALARAPEGGLHLLERSTNRRILIRMLRNLLNVYLRLRNFPSSLAVMDLLVHADPLTPELYRQRGGLQVKLNHLQRARSDYEKYLELAPSAKDRETVVEQLEAIHHWLGRMN